MDFELIRLWDGKSIQEPSSGLEITLKRNDNEPDIALKVLVNSEPFNLDSFSARAIMKFDVLLQQAIDETAEEVNVQTDERLEVGQILLADSERMEILEVKRITPNITTLGVDRAVAGTLPANHEKGISVHVFALEDTATVEDQSIEKWEGILTLDLHSTHTEKPGVYQLEFELEKVGSGSPKITVPSPEPIEVLIIPDFDDK